MRCVQTILMLLCLVFMSCEHKVQSLPLSLDGAWVQTHMSYAPQQLERDYPHEGHTFVSIYGPDSALCICGYMSGPNGLTVVPDQRFVFTLINKGGGEYLYFEDGEPRPLTVVDDTTIIIQRYGAKYTWVRERALTPRRLDEIKRLIYETEWDDDNPPHYVFSQAEDTLKEEKNILEYAIAGILAVLLLVGYYARESHKRRQNVERQLRQLNSERENRPQVVAEALKSVEEEFLTSDYYLTLCKNISRGKLSEAEWIEVEQHLNRVYPGLSGKLAGLYRMSQLEHRVCLLIKLRVSPSEMAAVLCKDVSTVSTIRRRLCHKVLGCKGSAKDWDEFVLSI